MKSFRGTQPSCGRPPVLTLFAVVCWIDAINRALIVALPSQRWTYSVWYQFGYRPFLSVLEAFPTPGALPAEVWRYFSGGATQSQAPGVLTAVAIGAALSALFGVGLWFLHRWARLVGLILLPATVLSNFLLPSPPGMGFKAGVGLPLLNVAPTLAQAVLASVLVYVLARRDFGGGAARAYAAPEPPRRAAAVVTVCMGLLALLNGVSALTALRLGRGDWSAALPFFLPPCALALLAAVAFVRLVRRGPNRLALGLATGVSACHLLWTVPFVRTPLLGALFGFGTTWYVAAISLPLSVVGAIFAITATRKLPRADFRHAGYWGLALFVPFALFAAGWSALQLAQRVQRRPRISHEVAEQLREESRSMFAAEKRVKAVARCAFLYAARRSESGYPEALQQLGPGGSACLSADQVSAPSDGYSLHYEARRNDAGAVVGFELGAEGEGTTPATSSITVDEHGTMASDNFSYVPAVGLMLKLYRCVERQRFNHASRAYPASLTPILKMLGDHQQPCVKFYGESDALTKWRADTAVVFRGHELVYSPRRDAAGSNVGYTLSARPQSWGELYFRSYLMDEGGIVHGTPFPRPARMGDPEIKSCENSGRSCYNGPWSFEFIEGGVATE